LTPASSISEALSQGLQALEARLAQDLAWLDLPSKPWVVSRSHLGAAMVDVVIVGAGMAGLAAATALKLMGIEARVFDRALEGFEGPWATTARMETLRSPKQLTGPALGLPALTFRAWYEAQFGEEAWRGLDKIPRLQWMDYLRWYRRVMGIEIHNEHAVERITPHPDGRVEVQLRHRDQPFTVQARRVILATGRDGLGQAQWPTFAQQIAITQRAHSSDALDYERLRDKRVAVIGAGSSAMDSAATALEAGALSLDLLIRRAELPRINKGKGAGSPGLTHGYLHLPDHWKWRLRRYINTQQVPPPRGSTLRVSRHPNVRFHLACPVLEVQQAGETVKLRTRKGWADYDFVIFSTGFRVDFSARAEFAGFSSSLRFWRDRFEPEAGDGDQELAESPDLGSSFEFLERTQGTCPGLDRIHCFCYPAVVSHGQISGDIPAISDGAQRLAQGIASAFFNEDITSHFENIKAYSDPELLGDEWQAAP
jgi:FAD-dependent urate hydroxylase